MASEEFETHDFLTLFIKTWEIQTGMDRIDRIKTRREEEIRNQTCFRLAFVFSLS